MHQNAFGGRAPPRQLGELTALPRPPSWIEGMEGEWEKVRGRGKEGRGGKRDDHTQMSEVR